MWPQILEEQSDQGPQFLPVCKNRFENFARTFSRQHKQMTFSNAGFLGILRIKINVCQSSTTKLIKEGSKIKQQIRDKIIQIYLTVLSF